MFNIVASGSCLSYLHSHCWPFFARSLHSKVDKPVRILLVPPVSSHARLMSSLDCSKSYFAPYTESRRLAAVSQLLSTQYNTL